MFLSEMNKKKDTVTYTVYLSAVRDVVVCCPSTCKWGGYAVAWYDEHHVL